MVSVYFPFYFGVENKFLGTTYYYVFASLSSLPCSTKNLNNILKMNDTSGECRGREMQLKI